MATYLLRSREEVAKFKNISLIQVPREQNSHTDALANLALAIHMDGQLTIVLEIMSQYVLDEMSE